MLTTAWLTEPAAAECVEASALFDTQRRSRTLLQTVDDHLGLNHLHDPRVGGKRVRRLIFVVGSSYWLDVPICGSESVFGAAQFVPSEASARLVVPVGRRGSLSLFGVGTHIEATSDEADFAEEDGQRGYLGMSLSTGAWFEAGFGVIIEEAWALQPETQMRYVVSGGVPALALSGRVVIGGTEAPVETVLVDMAIPVNDWLTVPTRLTWREDEGLFSGRVGARHNRWGGAWATVENSSSIARAAGIQANLLWFLHELVGVAPSGGTMGFGVEATLTWAGGQTLQRTLGESRVGGALDLVLRFGGKELAGDIRVGWARDEAGAIDESPHMAGFDLFRVHIGFDGAFRR